MATTVGRPDRPGYLDEQHPGVRLAAAGGYRAERSYAIASPPRSR